MIKTFLSLLLMVILSSGVIVAQDQWEAPPEADELENPYDWDEADIIELGQQTYEMLCAACHGDRADGAGAAGQTWNPPPADFRDAELHEQSDGALYWKIAEGNPPAMLQYKNMLSEEELWTLVVYIRQFAPE